MAGTGSVDERRTGFCQQSVGFFYAFEDLFAVLKERNSFLKFCIFADSEISAIYFFKFEFIKILSAGIFLFMRKKGGKLAAAPGKNSEFFRYSFTGRLCFLLML